MSSIYRVHGTSPNAFGATKFRIVEVIADSEADAISRVQKMFEGFEWSDVEYDRRSIL